MHPYSFVARVGFHELLTASDASSKTMPLLPKLAAHLRTALVSSLVSSFLLLCSICPFQSRRETFNFGSEIP